MAEASYNLFLEAVTSNTGTPTGWEAEPAKSQTTAAILAVLGRKVAEGGTVDTTQFVKSLAVANNAKIVATPERTLDPALIAELVAGERLAVVRLVVALRGEAAGKTAKLTLKNGATVIATAEPEVTAGGLVWYSVTLTQEEAEALGQADLEALVIEIEHETAGNVKAFYAYVNVETGTGVETEETSEPGIQAEKHYSPIPASSAILGVHAGSNKKALEGAADQGLDHARFQPGWEGTETYKAKAGSTWGGGALALQAPWPEWLKYCAEHGIAPILVAAFGPPHGQVCKVTVTKTITKAEAEAAPQYVIQVEVVGGGPMSQISVGGGGEPYGMDYLKASSGKLAHKSQPAGTLIVATTGGASATGTITLSAKLQKAGVAAGTVLTVNRQAYPPLQEPEEYANQSVLAFVRYLQFLANELHAAGCPKGYICVQNEPPWGGDTWTDLYHLYEGVRPEAVKPVPYIRPLLRGIRDQWLKGLFHLPSGITLISGATDKSTAASMFTTGLKPGVESIPPNIAELFGFEGNHPGLYQPDAGIWDKNNAYAQINPANGTQLHSVAQKQAASKTGVRLFLTETSDGHDGLAGGGKPSELVQAIYTARHIGAWWGEGVPIDLGTTTSNGEYLQKYEVAKRMIAMRNNLGVPGGSPLYAPAFVSVGTKAAKLITASAAKQEVNFTSAHGLSVGECFSLTGLVGGAGLIASEGTDPKTGFPIQQLYWVSQVIDATHVKVLPAGNNKGFTFTTDLTAGTLTPRAWPLLSSAIYAKSGGVRFIWQRTIGAAKPTLGTNFVNMPRPPAYPVVVSGRVTSAINTVTGAPVATTSVTGGTELLVGDEPIALIAETGVTRLRCRGSLTTTALIKAGEVIAELPKNLHPPKPIEDIVALNDSSAFGIKIAANGQITAPVDLPSGSRLSFEQIDHALI
jgi:hypothetical protein